VLESIEGAELVLIAPSNPVVSIGPILAVPGVSEALRRRRDTVVGISPIVGGVALKGPADRLLVELGGQASATGVARRLGSVMGTLVIDEVDRDLAAQVEDTGVHAFVTDTVMSTTERSISLVEAVLGSVERLQAS
ncbi:MAG: 2-phospho-L-lactate transferase CofD family protein, partial [Acidimicrobiales bacterium]